jgi:glycosyltransferase involved in cell wall biosynthesis
MVRDGETGWQFTSGSVEELAACLGAAQRMPADALERMGRAARALVERDFSRARYVESILGVYGALGVRS